MWIMLESCRQEFLDFLCDCIRSEHPVSVLESGKIVVQTRHNGVYVYHQRIPDVIDIQRCVYLPMHKKRSLKFSGQVSVVCSDTLPIQPDGKDYFPCGFSGAACLTISSKTDDRIVISLLRGMTSLYGRKIEPFELPIDRPSYLTDTEILMGYMTKLLLYPVQK